MQANLEWFRTFKAIYDTGTMSGAAKHLYISQPGVSLHLNALETYTGFPLFERTARKMIPTEKGKLLYQQVTQALSGLEDIEMRFKKKSGTHRSSISVGMCVETFQQALERHLPHLDFNLIMQFQQSEQLTLALEKGTLDLILTTISSTNKSLLFTPFIVERLILVAGREMNIAEIDQIDKNNRAQFKAWMQEQIWYNTASDMCMLNKFWEKNFNELPDFVPNFIVPNKFSIIRCLSQGKGLALLPDYLCCEALEKKQVHRIWKGYTPIESTLYFGKRKQSLFMDEILCLEDMLKEELTLHCHNMV